MLRVARTHAVARNFFAVRCGWSAKVLVFGELRKHARRQGEGRGRMLVLWHKLLARKKELGFRSWRAVAERVRWQQARLRMSVERLRRKKFELWKEWAREEKANRLLVEYGER